MNQLLDRILRRLGLVRKSRHDKDIQGWADVLDEVEKCFMRDFDEREARYKDVIEHLIS